MRKRLLSTLLALCMALTLLPGTALAADNEEGNIYYYPKVDPSKSEVQSQYIPLLAKSAYLSLFSGKADDQKQTILFQFTSKDALKGNIGWDLSYDIFQIFDRILPEGWDHFIECRSKIKGRGLVIDDLIGGGRGIIGYVDGVIRAGGADEGEAELRLTMAFPRENGNLLMRLMDIAAEAKNSSSTQRGQLEYINKYLIDHVRYGHTDLFCEGQSVTELLDKGWAVCGGYTHAVSYLCFLLGIPNIELWGRDHLWNCVYIDGEWKMLDVTWNDNMGNGSKAYFLVNSISGDIHDLEKYDDPEAISVAKETAIAIHDEIRKLKDGGTDNAGSTSGGIFSDVSASSPFADAISWAVEKGITTGLSTSIFGPGEGCTNGQILTFLWRANGSPEPTISNPYQDTIPSSFQKAAVWAYEKGLVSGEVFGASTPCTRAMTAEYLWKAAGSPVAYGNTAFTDVPANAGYAQAVAWAAENGVTSGTGNGQFSPDTTCTRGQIVTFLYRAMGN